MHLLKVAQIMSASKGNDRVIDEVDLAQALFHLDSIEGRMIKAFGAAGRSKIAPDIDEVRTLIRKEGSIDRIELLNRTWVNVDPTALEIVIGHPEAEGSDKCYHIARRKVSLYLHWRRMMKIIAMCWLVGGLFFKAFYEEYYDVGPIVYWLSWVMYFTIGGILLHYA